MGMSHHGDGRSERELHELRKRFLDQVAGNAKREWGAGRMGADDDGDLAYAITTDAKRGVIVLKFGKPVEWIGLGIVEAEQLRDQLTERLMELRGVTA
jgi:hypothetical protein